VNPDVGAWMVILKTFNHWKTLRKMQKSNFLKSKIIPKMPKYKLSGARFLHLGFQGGGLHSSSVVSCL